ncbi:cilia- and flagella-associated protein 20-like, partial [Condylostylus longicornis]|uniref:cilia- and flagella-associated protein 20-like n=1 Tax=Condylostylus longicornis TaxID=2530218 RepID=UPI00244E1B10
MFRNTYQKGRLSILYSCGSNPLSIWKSSVKNGHIKRVTDKDINSLVLEIVGTNIVKTYITTPIDPKMSLAIKLPFFILLVKNMSKFFAFEITILDDKNILRRFSTSNYQSITCVQTFYTRMPLGLSPDWNQIQFNLADFTRKAYGTNYLETVRVSIHANCRIRRIFFTDRLYTEEETPNEFKLILDIFVIFIF